MYHVLYLKDVKPVFYLTFLSKEMSSKDVKSIIFPEKQHSVFSLFLPIELFSNFATLYFLTNEIQCNKTLLHHNNVLLQHCSKTIFCYIVTEYNLFIVFIIIHWPKICTPLQHKSSQWELLPGICDCVTSLPQHLLYIFPRHAFSFFSSWNRPETA